MQKKSFFKTIIHTCSTLFTLSQKKTNFYPLTTTPEKCHRTTFQNANFFDLTEGNVAFLQTLVALRRTGCDVWQWNVGQATSEQVFKVTTFCTDTCFQSFSPLINCIVHHALVKFSPCCNKALPQLVCIVDSYLTKHSCSMSQTW